MPLPVPFSAPIASAASRPGFTDYLTGWGTIALAVVTVFALLVTVYTAWVDRRRDDKKRKEDREHEWQRELQRRLAQARLVLIGAPDISPRHALHGDLHSHRVSFSVENKGGRPVIGIEAEVWAGAAPLDRPCTSGDNVRILVAEESAILEVAINSPASEPCVRAWRIRWTDADGSAWCVDQAEQPEPLPYTRQPPRPC
jgi:hypothetical protein